MDKTKDKTKTIRTEKGVIRITAHSPGSLLYATTIAETLYSNILKSAQAIDPTLTREAFLLEFVDEDKLEFTSSSQVAEIVKDIPKILENTVRIYDALQHAIARNKGDVSSILESGFEIDPALKDNPFSRKFEIIETIVENDGAIVEISEPAYTEPEKLYEYFKTQSPTIHKIVEKIRKEIPQNKKLLSFLRDTLENEIEHNSSYVTSLLHSATQIDPNLENAPELQKMDRLQAEIEGPKGHTVSIYRGGYVELEELFEYFETYSPTVYRILETARKNVPTGMRLLRHLHDTVRDEKTRLKQLKVKKQRNSKLPSVVRQHTFQEVRNLGQAITDGVTLQNWKEIPGEVALGHTIEGQPIETKLTAGKDIDWFGAPVTYDNLREELRKLTPEGVLLFQFALESVLLHQHATLSLDDLIHEIGWTPKNREDRNQMRWQVYYWLCIFTNFTSHGTRPGIYKNPTTKEKGKIITSSSYFAITDKERLEDSDIPLRITLTASKWITDHRNDNAVLQHFGNLRKLAGLPTGQPRGEYALCIGLTAFQKWREDATRCETKRIGEQNVETVIYKPLARFDLLNMFRPGKFPIMEILKSDRPKRAQVYWNEALTELKKRGVIGHYKAPDDKALPRQGWQDNWLYGKNIEMRPFGDERQAAVELSKSASSKRKRFKNTGPKTKTP